MSDFASIMHNVLSTNILSWLSCSILGEKCSRGGSQRCVEFNTHTLDLEFFDIKVLICRKSPLNGIIFSEVFVLSIKIEGVYVAGNTGHITEEQNRRNSLEPGL